MKSKRKDNRKKAGDHMAAFLLCPALAMGIIIGIIEFGFVHADEPGGIGFGHAFHALPFAVLAVFISMNIPFVLGLLNINLTENFTLDLLIRVGVAVALMVKIQMAAAIGRGVGEKIPHTLLIGGLIFVAPYAWDFVLKGLVGGYLPC
jgi:hypothetical protein